MTHELSLKVSEDGCSSLCMTNWQLVENVLVSRQSGQRWRPPFHWSSLGMTSSGHVQLEETLGKVDYSTSCTLALYKSVNASGCPVSCDNVEFFLLVQISSK